MKMKRLLILCSVGIMLLVFGKLFALAHSSDSGVQIHDPSYILAGVPFAYSGTVSEVGYLTGGGLILATQSGGVKVYGLGPWWYWENERFDWPQVGDTLSVSGHAVELDGVTTNILMQVITIDGKTLQLRDPETGWPLWVGGR